MPEMRMLAPYNRSEILSACRTDDSPWCSPGTCAYCDAASKAVAPKERNADLLQSCQGLLKIIDGIGGYLVPEEQFIVRQARRVIDREIHVVTEREKEPVDKSVK